MAAQHSNGSVEEVVPLSGGLFALPDVVDVVASQLVPSSINSTQTPINSPVRHRPRLAASEAHSIAVNFLVPQVPAGYIAPALPQVPLMPRVTEVQVTAPAVAAAAVSGS